MTEESVDYQELTQCYSPLLDCGSAHSKIVNNDPCVGFGTTQHHVTAALATKDETNRFITAGQRRGDLGHVALPRSFDLDQLLACFQPRGSLDIRRDGFADVDQGFRAAITLADTARQGRNAGHRLRRGGP